MLWGELRQAQKPLILVFNKIDLYTDAEREQIYENLRSLSLGKEAWVRSSEETEAKAENSQIPIFDSAFSEVVMVAAEPTSIPVRVEWGDGRVTHEWGDAAAPNR